MILDAVSFSVENGVGENYVTKFNSILYIQEMGIAICVINSSLTYRKELHIQKYSHVKSDTDAWNRCNFL